MPHGNYFVDINPSVRITTNRRGKVRKVEGLNDDAKALLAVVNFDDDDLDDVVEDLVDAAISRGYLKEDTENFIMLSQEGKTDEELKNLKGKIDEYVLRRKLNTKVATKSTDKNHDRKALEEMEISAAKLELIEEILENDRTRSASELKNLSILELVNILKSQNRDLDDIFDDYDDLYDDDLDDDLDDLYDDDLDDLYDDDFDYLDDNKINQSNQPTQVVQPVPTQVVQPQPQKPQPQRVYKYDDDDDDWDDWDDDNDNNDNDWNDNNNNDDDNDWDNND